MPAAYERLDAAHVVATIERLERRIAARFPDRGLRRAASELVTVAAQVVDTASTSRRRLRWIRLISRALSVVIMIVTVIAVTLLLSGTPPRVRTARSNGYR